MKRFTLPFFLIVALILLGDKSCAQQKRMRDTSAVTVMLRFDDIGMCHAVNSAIREVIAAEMPMSVSVMFACPWYQEAVAILKEHPKVSVGVHLVLNSEWKNYRWGPVSGEGSVPSLVDSNGYFFPTRALLFAHAPRVEEVERELRAQIERAVHSGLKIDYVDYHMGAAVQTPELRAVVEELAGEYHLGISRYFGERDADGVYAAPIESKIDTLMHIARSLAPNGIWLFVFHIGEETPEMDALVDMNSFGPKMMSKQRNAELKAALSEPFQDFLKSKRVRVRSYRDIIMEVGLEHMQRPQE